MLILPLLLHSGSRNCWCLWLDWLSLRLPLYLSTHIFLRLPSRYPSPQWWDMAGYALGSLHLSSLNCALFERVFKILTSLRNLIGLTSLWLNWTSCLLWLLPMLTSFSLLHIHCLFCCLLLNGFLLLFLWHLLLSQLGLLLLILNKHLLIFNHDILNIFWKYALKTTIRLCMVSLQILDT